MFNMKKIGKILGFYCLTFIAGFVVLPATFSMSIALIAGGILVPIVGFANIFARIFWPDVALLQIFGLNLANPIVDGIVKFLLAIPIGIILSLAGIFLWKFSFKVVAFTKKYALNTFVDPSKNSLAKKSKSLKQAKVRDKS